MTRPSFLFLLLFLLVAGTAPGQIVVLDSFNPAETGDLCGIGFDHETGNVWVYACFGDSLYGYSPAGDRIGGLARPGESANDVDISFAPYAFNLNGTTIPSATLLFINGETDVVDVYGVDKNTGTVLATLNTLFGNSHVVGGAYHPIRSRLFLVQDQVPAPGLSNKIGEMSSVTGDTFFVYDVPSGYSVNYGDLEIDGGTGNLYLVSSSYTTIAEATTGGTLVQLHSLPGGVSSVSGIALDCDSSEAWVATTGGEVFHLGDMPCGPATSVQEVENVVQEFALVVNHPNPFNPSTTIRYTIPGALFIHMAVYDVLGNLVRVLVNEPRLAGTHHFVWDATDAANQAVPSGTYFCRLQAGEFTETTKLMLLR